MASQLENTTKKVELWIAELTSMKIKYEMMRTVVQHEEQDSRDSLRLQFPSNIASSVAPPFLLWKFIVTSFITKDGVLLITTHTNYRGSCELYVFQCILGQTRFRKVQKMTKEKI